jgi:predicted amidohydrolase
MADFNHLSEAEAIRELAQHTEAVKLKFQEFAISYNINIITGSMPFIEDEHVYNVGFLCKRDGTNEMYRKIHITPNEVFHWELRDTIQTFDRLRKNRNRDLLRCGISRAFSPHGRSRYEYFICSFLNRYSKWIHSCEALCASESY